MGRAAERGLPYRAKPGAGTSSVRARTFRRTEALSLPGREAPAAGGLGTTREPSWLGSGWERWGDCWVTVGVDLVLRQDSVVIEINPRLTTSYLGRLRQACRENLAEADVANRRGRDVRIELGSDAEAIRNRRLGRGRGDSLTEPRPRGSGLSEARPDERVLNYGAATARAAGLPRNRSLAVRKAANAEGEGSNKPLPRGFVIQVGLLDRRVVRRFHVGRFDISSRPVCRSSRSPLLLSSTRGLCRKAAHDLSGGGLARVSQDVDQLHFRFLLHRSDSRSRYDLHGRASRTA